MTLDSCHSDDLDEALNNKMNDEDIDDLEDTL